MKKLFLVFLLILQGCGPAYFLTESYKANPYEAYKYGERKVFVGIAPTYEINDRLPFYYSRKISAPYELSLTLLSDKTDKGTATLVEAQISMSDGTSFELVDSSHAMSCHLVEATFNNEFSECKILIPLESNLKFIEGYEFTAKVTFMLSGSAEEHTVEVVFRGVREEEKGNTFDIYMGV